MEAYGLFVSDVCVRSNLAYNYGPRTLTYTCLLYTSASGQTIVMVTHSVRAASCASRVLFLRDGEVSLELKRGKDTDSQFYQRITDALTQQQTGGECA